MTTTALILAAGESKRLGQPKQLLPFRGSSLISQAVTTARSAGIGRVIVVTGAYSEEVVAELSNEQCECIPNTHWHLGLGSSIACGAGHLLSLTPLPRCALLMLCDQPFIPSRHLRRLIETVEADNRHSIAATEYPDRSPGIPACFSSVNFPALSELAGPTGAKEMIRRGVENGTVKLFSCPEADIDVDVQSDLDAIRDSDDSN